MAQRFFVDSPITGHAVVLVGPEAHHLVTVLRARPDDEVVLFDGSGAEFGARIRCASRRRVELDVFSRQEINRELPFELVLGVALPKGDRQGWLVEKAVELGVTRLVPLITARGVVQPRENRLVRLRRTVMEASKQCGRNRLMEISEPLPLADYLCGVPLDATRLIALSDGRRLCGMKLPKDSVYAAVGPEGGFTPEEISQSRESGWKPVGLGPRTLRIETAAIAVAAFFSLPSDR